MDILVDTSVWSLALRKKTVSSEERLIIAELEELIKELRVKMAGPIRQELLSGISDDKKFNTLKKHLSAFDDINITTADYEFAAEISNRCRQNGIQGSHIDYLICSVAINNKLGVFTTDNDFKRYSAYCGLKLYRPRSSE